MKRFPINRACPVSGEQHSRVLGFVPASVVGLANPTYRSNFTEILGISAEDEFPVVESPCGFVFSGWRPPDDFLRRVYEEVIDHSKTVTGTVDYRVALLELSSAFLRTAEKHLHSRPKPFRLLDFGCGYGALTQMLGGRDVLSFGYDPSFARRARASDGGFEILDSLEGTAEAGPFDLLICTEVLEHVPSPREVLQFLRSCGAPCAVLAITVPQCEPVFINNEFAIFRSARTLPPVINPWEHLNYFSRKALVRLLEEEGFRILSDFGQARSALDAALQVGESVSMMDRLINDLRLLKRILVSSQTTQLFCEKSG